MKRMLAVLALLIAGGGGALSAQTRVAVSLSFGAPFAAYHPRRYGYDYDYDYGYSYRYPYRGYVVYDPRPTIVVVRRYRPAPVFVVRGYRRHRYHRW